MTHEHSLPVLVPAALLSLFLFFCITKYRIKSASIILISIYILSTVTASLIDPLDWYPYFNERSYKISVFLAYGILLLISLLPAIRVIEAPENIKELNSGWIRSTMWTMIIGSTYAIIYQFPYALQAGAIDASTFRREMALEQVYLLPDSPATTLAVFFSTFYIYHIALAFYSSVIGGSSRRTFLLWATSVASLVNGATFATRDAVVFYTLSVAFNYIYFKPVLSAKSRRISVIGIFGAVIASISYFTYISLQRFMSISGNSLSWGTIGYIASQPYTFAEAVASHTNFYNGDLRFPLFKLPFNNFEFPNVIRYYNYETMFGTFLKDIFSEGGWTFLVAFVILISSTFIILMRPNPRRVMSGLIIQLFYIQFMFTGLFYFVLGSRQGNIYTIIVFSAFLACRIWENRRSRR